MKENMKLLFYKPWKLILSIFLSALIVASVAISSASFTTNSKEKSIDWIYKNVNGYVNVSRSSDNEQSEDLRNQTNLDFLKTYSTNGSMQSITIPYHKYVYNTNLYNKSDFSTNLFVGNFASFDDDKNIEKDLDFAYGSNLPKEGEIAINDLLLEYFKNFGYKNMNDENDFILASDLQKDPSKIIGKTLHIYAKNEYSGNHGELNGKDLTICSVINTGLITKTNENNFIYNFGLYNLNIISKDYLQTLLNSAYFDYREASASMYVKIKDKNDFSVLMNYLYKIENNKDIKYDYYSLDGYKIYIKLLSTKKYEQHYLDINNVEYNKDSLPEDKEIASISMKIHDDQIVYTDLYGGYNYDNLKNISIVLISIATILLIIFLANIVPYIKDEIANNPDYFKKLKHTKKLAKFFLVQYLVLACSTFVVSLVLSFFLSLITNSLMIGSAYGEIYKLSIFYPITVNYICVLVSLGLSLLLILFGFVFVKKYLKNISD